MQITSSMTLLVSCTLMVLPLASPQANFYSQFYGNIPQDSVFGGSHSPSWIQPLRNPTSTHRRNSIDPVAAAAANDAVKENIPRQAPFIRGYPGDQPAFQGYPQGGPQVFPQGSQVFPQRSQGFPQDAQGYPQGFQQGPQGFQQGPSRYPQIYKIDNIIVIANPSPFPQPEPCTPTKSLQPLDINKFPTPPKSENMNRFGEGSEAAEPSKCTWAIVTCCSPNNANVRFNCFELLGCPGLFFDESPCSGATVMGAAQSALDFYRNGANSTASDNTNKL